MSVAKQETFVTIEIARGRISSWTLALSSVSLCCLWIW